MALRPYGVKSICGLACPPANSVGDPPDGRRSVGAATTSLKDRFVDDIGNQLAQAHAATRKASIRFSQGVIRFQLAPVRSIIDPGASPPDPLHALRAALRRVAPFAWPARGPRSRPRRSPRCARSRQPLRYFFRGLRPSAPSALSRAALRSRGSLAALVRRAVDGRRVQRLT